MTVQAHTADRRLVVLAVLGVVLALTAAMWPPPPPGSVALPLSMAVNKRHRGMKDWAPFPRRGHGRGAERRCLLRFGIFVKHRFVRFCFPQSCQLLRPVGSSDGSLVFRGGR